MPVVKRPACESANLSRPYELAGERASLSYVTARGFADNAEARVGRACFDCGHLLLFFHEGPRAALREAEEKAKLRGVRVHRESGNT